MPSASWPREWGPRPVRSTPATRRRFPIPKRCSTSLWRPRKGLTTSAGMLEKSACFPPTGEEVLTLSSQRVVSVFRKQCSLYERKENTHEYICSQACRAWNEHRISPWRLGGRLQLERHH